MSSQFTQLPSFETGFPSGPAGGALTGTYPNPGLANPINGNDSTPSLNFLSRKLLGPAGGLNAGGTLTLDYSMTNAQGVFITGTAGFPAYTGQLNLKGDPAYLIGGQCVTSYLNPNNPTKKWVMGIDSGNGNGDNFFIISQTRGISHILIDNDNAFSILYDQAGNASVDWHNHQLYDTGGSEIADYGNFSQGFRFLSPVIFNDYIVDLGSNFPSIDVNNRHLVVNSSGSPQQVLDWQSQRLINVSNNVTVDWGNGYLYDTSSIVRCNWLTSTLNDASQVKSYDWNARKFYALDGTTQTLDVSGTSNVVVNNADFSVNTAGKGLKIKEGSNARMGVATLVAGTKTVSNTSVSSTTRIFLTVQSLGTVAVATPIAVTARSAGTSFTITSASVTDTSTIAYLLVEPA